MHDLSLQRSQEISVGNTIYRPCGISQVGYPLFLTQRRLWCQFVSMEIPGIRKWLSLARTAHKEELFYLLNQADHSVQPEAISQMLMKIRTHCPWYPEARLLKSTDWEKIGIHLHEEQCAPIEILHAWYLCRNNIF